MGTEVIMPQLGESVIEGTVTKWLKGEGEVIEEFEALLEINTDKVDTEIPSPASGDLLRVYVTEGETVRAGTLLAFIGEKGESIPEGTEVHVPMTEAKAAPTVAIATQTTSPKTTGRSSELGFISPVVARIAADRNVDLSRVRGTGQGGRITKKDVIAYLKGEDTLQPWEQPASGELFRPSEEVYGVEEKSSEAGKPGTMIPHDAVRKSIADHMVRSVHTSPHVTTVMEVDFSRVVAHRVRNKEIFARDGVNLTYSAYFLAASVVALKHVPIVNASWSDEGVILHQEVNVGMAVSLGEKGLIVPVIRDADQLSLLAIAREINDKASRAREGKLNPDEVHGGTFTITNHGVSNSLFATPIINQPEAAILGVGAIQKRVVVIEARTSAGEPEDAFAIRPMVYLSLTFDHRIMDGAIGDAFLGKVVSTLSDWS
ncbi:MAG: dihydrolipoamide acetyltransferase family protein [Anaerolineales bacterium]